MFTMQLVNGYTQETIREHNYDDVEFINQTTKSFERNKRDKLDLYIFDEQRTTFKGEYLSHKVFKSDGNTVYRILLKVKMNDVQAVIRG